MSGILGLSVSESGVVLPQSGWKPRLPAVGLGMPCLFAAKWREDLVVELVYHEVPRMDTKPCGGVCVTTKCHEGPRSLAAVGLVVWKNHICSFYVSPLVCALTRLQVFPCTAVKKSQTLFKFYHGAVKILPRYRNYSTTVL